MSDVPHLPALRAGRPYESLDTVELRDHKEPEGAPIAVVSQVNAGIVRRDLKRARDRADRLGEIPIQDLIDASVRAADIFLEETLTQSPDEYVAALSSTSGLPHSMCRGNMHKCATVMREMPTILRGLMRGMEPTVLDGGVGQQDGIGVWYSRTTDALGAVLPSNSPGVHSLWIPSVVLKIPVVLKPGREEPWTPMRIAEAMTRAGIPAEAFSLYPTDHEGARVVIEECGRSLLFGDARTTDPYAARSDVEIHGPGRSKVLIGPDEIENWREHLDVLVASVCDNGGRSCINASAIFVPSHGDEIATAMAERMGGLRPSAREDPEAKLAAFANPAFASAMNASIQNGLGSGDAVEVTGHGEDRLVEHDGATYLLPTVVRTNSLEHPLANTEFLFPFTSVVEVPADEMIGSLGPSLVVTAVTHDERLVRGLLGSGDVHRLNLGPLPTSRVEWDQPHEGNLFEFLYARRALQRGAGW